MKYFTYYCTVHEASINNKIIVSDFQGSIPMLHEQLGFQGLFCFMENRQCLTPEGFKDINNLSEGDLIVAWDGTFCPILNIFPKTEMELVKVSFSDGSYIECGKEQLFSTQSPTDKANDFMDIWSINEIKKDYISPTRYKYVIPINKPVLFQERKLLIRPYLMGLLLGDGSFRDSTIGFTTSDIEIFETMDKLIKLDYPTCNIRKVNNTKYGYRIAKNKGVHKRERTPIRLALEHYNLADKLSEDKHIPTDYLFSSLEDRIELFQGLIDSDGTIGVNNGCISYSTSSLELCKDFTFLAKSIGARVWVASKKTSYKYNGEIKCGLLSYRVNVILPRGIAPCKLKRKLDRYNPSFRNLQKWIIKVEDIGIGNYQNILIDHPDQLYIGNNFTIIHI